MEIDSVEFRLATIYAANKKAEATSPCARCARVEDTEGLTEYLRQSFKSILSRDRCAEIALAVQRWVKEG